MSAWRAQNETREGLQHNLCICCLTQLSKLIKTILAIISNPSYISPTVLNYSSKRSLCFNRDLALPDLEEDQMLEEPALEITEAGDEDGSGRYIRQMIVENIFSV